jgi:hypothetical protein
MANVKYFSGTTELKNVYGLANAKFRAAFPTVRGRRYDGFSMFVGHPVSGPDAILPVERVISYKFFPSKHECNAKCMGGKVNGSCECKCGGRNHGLGSVGALGKPLAEVIEMVA